MDIITMQLIFFFTCVKKQKIIFENMTFFAYLIPPWQPRGGRAMDFTILILLP